MSTWDDAMAANAARRRDAHTEQLIADARGPVETPLDEAMKEFDVAIEAKAAELSASQPPMMPALTLTGESRDAYLAFAEVARQLEDHQRSAAEVMERYRAALARLSAAATK